MLTYRDDGNILGEATTASGNIYLEAMRTSKTAAKTARPRVFIPEPCHAHTRPQKVGTTLPRARTLARLPTQLAHAAGVPRTEFSSPCHPAEPRIRTALLTPATAG